MNHTNTLKTSLTALSIALLLVGCNDNSDSPKTKSSTSSTPPPVVSLNTITVTPSLGKILNARVVLRNARTGVELGRSNTGLSGTASFSIAKTIDNVVVEVLGGGAARYFDEATGEQALPENISLRAASAIVNHSNVGISVFTEAAVQHAEKLPEGLKKPENIVQANKTIGEAVGISQITQAPTVIDDDNDYQQLTDNAASKYALQLAALVKAAADQVSGNTPALDLLAKLASDLSDGLVDGKNGTTPLTDLPYASLASVFAAAWQLAMQELVNSLPTSTVKDNLQTEVVDKVDIKEVINGEVVDGDGVFGGDDKKPWKGEIYLLELGAGQLPDFSTLTPIGTLFTGAINIAPQPFNAPFPGVPSDRFEYFAVRYQGPLTILAEGDYSFRLVSDDGSKLFINDELVINFDGVHGAYSSPEVSVNLKKGVHTLRVEYFQGPRFEVALQVFGHKVGLPEQVLTPVIPITTATE